MNAELRSTLKEYKDVFEGIRKYGKNVCPLRTLVDVLKKRPNKILEINRLASFPTDPFYNGFTPKLIIRYMRNIYLNMFIKPSDLVKFVYKYNSDDEEKEYFFSNYMTIYEDVIIICYLYCIMTSKSEYKESQSVIQLREIMRKKYIICDDLDDSTEEITWFKIAHSFPSITFAIFHHDIIDVSISFCNTFPNNNLPKIFNVPFLAPILPRFIEKLYTPLALLMVFAVLIDNEKCSGEKTSLKKLWDKITDYYFSDIYPSSLKFCLCYKWDIIKMENENFEYTHYFDDVCVEALDLISYLRPNDPYLHKLSITFNMPFFFQVE